MTDKIKKMPPKEKIHEAISVLADNRIEINEKSAHITSSDYSKKYTVTWNEDNSRFTSNDSATVWQGYPGYPILAVLMQKNTLPVPENITPFFKGVNWNTLNAKYRRNYSAAVNEALAKLSPEERQEVDTVIDELYEKIGSMGIEVGRGKEKLVKLDIE